MEIADFILTVPVVEYYFETSELGVSDNGITRLTG